MIGGDKTGDWQRRYFKNIPAVDDLLDAHLRRLLGR